MPNHSLKIIFTLSALLTSSKAIGAPATPLPDPARVAAIEQLLPDSATGIGPTIADRAAWQKLAGLPGYQALLKKADKLLGEPVTPLPDSLYLMFTQNGSRAQSDNATILSRGNFQSLVLAECVRNDGRYLAKITNYVHALCAQKSWLYSAHDPKLTNFHGTAIDVELASSALGWNMATTLWMLGDKLDPDTRALLHENLQRRILTPCLDRYTGKQAAWWWQTAEMNWNPVCLAGITGTALEEIPDRHTRALFVAAAELYSAYFLKGFPADGYCTEGLGYWNYGFGHYVMLSEVVRQATAGKIDLVARPDAQAPATFGTRIQIINSVAPAFADCPVYPKADPELMVYVNRRFSLGLAACDENPAATVPSDLTAEAVYRFDNAAAETPPATNAPYRLRDFFNTAGILIARPALHSDCHIGVALKGGNNNEAHNHNDLGSYVFVLNKKCLILDPGSEHYTARTFSAHRYDSNLLNSFGHAVPVVADQLQRTGAIAQAKVLQADFTDTTDTFTLDLTTAYDVPALQKLTRTWIYSREGKGSLTITDHATFSSPQSFATALITLGSYSITDHTHLVVTDAPESATITISSSAPTTLTQQVIHEDAAVTPTRMAVTLNEKTTDATITLTIVPNN
jgi:hypothetical protein